VRESEREHIEADACEDTKTTTKRRKRNNMRKKNKNAIETPHVAKRARRRGFPHRLETLIPDPNLNFNILERPDER
jgi:hypothetical protein